MDRIIYILLVVMTVMNIQDVHAQKYLPGTEFTIDGEKKDTNFIEVMRDLNEDFRFSYHAPTMYDMLILHYLFPKESYDAVAKSSYYGEFKSSFQWLYELNSDKWKAAMYDKYIMSKELSGSNSKELAKEKAVLEEKLKQNGHAEIYYIDISESGDQQKAMMILEQADVMMDDPMMQEELGADLELKLEKLDGQSFKNLSSSIKDLNIHRVYGPVAFNDMDAIMFKFKMINPLVSKPDSILEKALLKKLDAAAVNAHNEALLQDLPEDYLLMLEGDEMEMMELFMAFTDNYTGILGNSFGDDLAAFSMGKFGDRNLSADFILAYKNAFPGVQLEPNLELYNRVLTQTMILNKVKANIFDDKKPSLSKQDKLLLELADSLALYYLARDIYIARNQFQSKVTDEQAKEWYDANKESLKGFTSFSYLEISSNEEPLLIEAMAQLEELAMGGDLDAFVEQEHPFEVVKFTNQSEFEDPKLAVTLQNLRNKEFGPIQKQKDGTYLMLYRIAAGGEGVLPFEQVKNICKNRAKVELAKNSFQALMDQTKAGHEIIFDEYTFQAIDMIGKEPKTMGDVEGDR